MHQRFTQGTTKRLHPVWPQTNVVVPSCHLTTYVKSAGGRLLSSKWSAVDGRPTSTIRVAAEDVSALTVTLGGKKEECQAR
jgi:glycine cleavage system regulatory protein